MGHVNNLTASSLKSIGKSGDTLVMDVVAQRSGGNDSRLVAVSQTQFAHGCTGGIFLGYHSTGIIRILLYGRPIGIGGDIGMEHERNFKVLT